MTHFSAWLGVKPHVVPESHITCPWLQSFFNMPQPMYKLRNIFQACRWVHRKGQVCYWNSSPSANNSTKIQVWLSFSFFIVSGQKIKNPWIFASRYPTRQGWASDNTEICAVKGRPCNGQQRESRSPMIPPSRPPKAPDAWPMELRAAALALGHAAPKKWPTPKAAWVFVWNL